jgi:hypothetical protein
LEKTRETKAIWLPLKSDRVLVCASQAEMLENAHIVMSRTEMHRTDLTSTHFNQGIQKLDVLGGGGLTFSEGGGSPGSG